MDAVHILLDAGAAVDVRVDGSQTFLYRHAERGDEVSIHSLLEIRADVHTSSD